MNTKKALGLAAAAGLLLGPATAIPASAAPGDEKEPKPPAVMSDVGGKQLARPGTQVNPGAGAPEVPGKLTARSWIVSDAESGEILAAHNAHWKLAPASTLKMLFADTLLPKFGKTQEHKVTRSELAEVQPGSSLVGIKEGLSYTVHDLWLGVFLRSGNDAVHVLTEMNGGKQRTVDDMQAKADDLGAADTVVKEPDGYDAKGQSSSAYDLTLFARQGMKNPDFREYASTPSAKFPGEKKKGKRKTFEIQNTNRLLTGDYDLDVYKGIAGIKNGNTTEAGATFTGVAERDGKVLLVTMMHPKGGHNQVYQETAKLFDWGFKAAGTVQPVGKLVPPKSERQDAKGSAEGNQAGGAKGSASGSDESGKSGRDGGGITTALSITAGSLALLALIALLVKRRWPLPDIARRGRPAGAIEQQAGHEGEPEDKGDGHAEGSVDALGGDRGEVAAEKKLE
ncbi:D-alanyl-D-alanine carboxypeptidase family protein [Streptomyces boninensis]|uniref:D-alanyl-D-alanine carboxypeptidase family protein n=1 Tax=Streptomyces boninensis TaxID=2039455 RepID=UPI003B217F88